MVCCLSPCLLLWDPKAVWWIRVLQVMETVGNDDLPFHLPLWHSPRSLIKTSEHHWASPSSSSTTLLAHMHIKINRQEVNIEKDPMSPAQFPLPCAHITPGVHRGAEVLPLYALPADLGFVSPWYILWVMMMIASFSLTKTMFYKAYQALGQVATTSFNPHEIHGR